MRTVFLLVALLAAASPSTAAPDADGGAGADALAALVAPAPEVVAPSSVRPHLEPTAVKSDAPVGAPVTLHGRTAFTVPGPLDGVSAQARARAAGVIIGRALEESEHQVTLAAQPGGPNVQLVVDGAVVLDLAPTDAQLRGLPAPIYYETVRVELATYLDKEARRSQLQQSVLSVSLIVFAGLILLLAIRFVRSRAADARGWTERLAQGQGLRIRDLEVLSPQTVEGVLYVLVGVGSLLLQVAMLYGYLVYTMSRFAFSRGWVDPLSHVVFGPIVGMGRHIGGAIPTLVLLIIGFYVVRGALRLVSVYFSHVARGELQSPFGAPDTAVPARTIASAAVVIIAFLTLGPLAGDHGMDAFSLVAYLTIGAVALGLVPVLASAGVGLIVLFGRRIRPGEWVRIGDLVGEVADVSFVDLTLVPPGSGRVRLPHLTLLFSAVQHLTEAPHTHITVPVDPRVAPATVITLLGAAAKPLGVADVRIDTLTGEAALYRVSLRDAHPEATGPLWLAVTEALQGAGLATSLAAGLAKDAALAAAHSKAPDKDA